MEVEILKMLPAYMIPSAIVVWLFYQMLQHRDATLEKIAASFATKVETMDLAHQKQIDTIVDQFTEMQANSQGAQKAIVDDYIKITREAVTAMSGMASSDREIRDLLAQIKPK